MDCFKGCINGCLMELVGFCVIGLIIALICGLPEIVAWLGL